MYDFTHAMSISVTAIKVVQDDVTKSDAASARTIRETESKDIRKWKE